MSLRGQPRGAPGPLSPLPVVFERGDGLRGSLCARSPLSLSSEFGSDSAPPLIRAEGLTKTYNAAEPVHAIRSVTLTVERGELLAIMGASSSGKSTLMNLLGCLDTPTAGSYRLDGVEVVGLTRNARADLRNEKLDFVFQGFNLHPRTSAVDNVLLPLLYDRPDRSREPRAKAVQALKRVGLGHRLGHEPSELSSGQQQVSGALS